MEKSLVKIVEENGLEVSQAQGILSHFTKFFEDAAGWEKKAKALVVTDVAQVLEMSEARKARLALKEIRVNAEKTRKELKEKSLREGKAIDGIANVIKALIEPLEEHLEKQEKFAEVQAALAAERLLAERTALLGEYVEDTRMYNLKEMSQEGFDKLLETSKIAKKAQEEAEAKAKEEAIKKAEEEKAEQERIRLENQKLKEEAEAKDKAMEAERAKAEKKRKKAEAEKEKERKAKEKLEKELKAKKDAEEKEKKEKEERERKEAEDAKRLEKVKAYQKFLAENGYTQENKQDFHVERVGDEVRLYKLVGKFSTK